MPNFKHLYNPQNHNLCGEYGEALARLFFITYGWRVSEAGGDWYPYDLTVERHGKLTTVQVKTAQNTTQDGYYRCWFGAALEFDVAFIVTAELATYLIPNTVMKFSKPRAQDRRRFVLYPKYERFKLGSFIPFASQQESHELVTRNIEWNIQAASYGALTDESLRFAA